MPAPVPSILIIRHEPGLRIALTVLLLRRGYRVRCAQRGRAGIRRLRKVKPDVVISDVRMPEATGLDVVKAAREVDPLLPVILITGPADADTAIQALNEGAVQVIQEPFVLGEVVAQVQNALRLRGVIPNRGDVLLPEGIQLHEPRTPGSDAPPATPTMELIERAYCNYILEAAPGNRPGPAPRARWVLSLGCGS